MRLCRFAGWDKDHDKWCPAADVGTEAISEYEAGLLEGKRAVERFGSAAERLKAMEHAGTRGRPALSSRATC